MYTYMEYLQKRFDAAAGWDEDNLFANITASLRALLEFGVPTWGRLNVSSKLTPHLALSFTLLNRHQINGSVAYLYSLLPLAGDGTAAVALQEAVAGFRPLRLAPPPQAAAAQAAAAQAAASQIASEAAPAASQTSRAALRPRRRQPHAPHAPHAPPAPPARPAVAASASLLYGRLYFPGSALEAMLIKRFSPSSRLLVKCVSNPHAHKNGTMILYLQTNTARFLREFVYSTNEALFGFRCLYNLSRSPLLPKLDNLVMLIGTEVWYAALSTSPGLLTALRYLTRLALTGKPMTMTLACNPILGHVSSTYTIKTSVRSTFCSKYDFNWFLYASNLSLGFELFSYRGALGAAAARTDNAVDAFQHRVNESDFGSVLKVSTSLSDKVVKVLWEGKVKDFLVSTGVHLSMRGRPEVGKVGLSLSYAC